MIAFIYSLFFVISQSSASSTPQILIQNYQANNASYLAYLATQSQVISYTEYEMKSLRDRQKGKTLVRQFEYAQRAYLSANIPKALNEFRNIIARKHETHWDSEEQLVIFYSFLRLYQLSSNDVEKRQLLESAYLFLPTGRVDSTLFPPPVLNAWTQVTSTYPTILWQPDFWIEDYTQVLINGRIYKIRPGFSLTLPRGPIRLSLLSNKRVTLTTVIETHKLPYFQGQSEILSQGSCGTHSLFSQKFSVYFHEDCITPPQNEVGTLSKSFVANENSWPDKPLPSPHTSSSVKWYKNKWVLGGLAAASVAIYISQQTANTTIQTTNTPGGVVVHR